jgi:hypothetical protein
MTPATVANILTRITLPRLAVRLGVNPSTVSRWAHGAVPRRNVARVQEILDGIWEEVKHLPVREDDRQSRPAPESCPRPPKPPATRAGCADVPRPCPCRLCAYNTILDFPRATVSCVLDVTDMGSASPAEVATALGIDTDRVGHFESRALRRIGAALREYK